MKEVNKLYTVTFWKDAVERALKTAAQVVIGFFVADISIFDVEWSNAFSVAAAAAVLSLLTSFVSAPVNVKGTASLVNLAGEGE
jgi:hypothetical protein